jgi:hypothetical protein
LDQNILHATQHPILHEFHFYLAFSNLKYDSILIKN